MKKQMTFIYYHVPEDKDDPEVPNVFGISIKKDDLRVRHIQQNFPISGEYIFRFKIVYQNNIAWMDLQSKDAKVPSFKDKIMVKASRVSWENAKSKQTLSNGTNTKATQKGSPLKKKQEKAINFNLIDDSNQRDGDLL